MQDLVFIAYFRSDVYEHSYFDKIVNEWDPGQMRSGKLNPM